jgi:peptidoglycan hydrolase-like protein with peptidoglycan-binding domain
MKKIIKLTETELNRIIKKVISEQQTLRTSNLQAPEDMDPNPIQKPKSDFGLKTPGAPKFMPDVSSKANTSAGYKSPVTKTPSKTFGVLSPDLYMGSKGQEVKQFQAGLGTLGYGTKPDGIFGPITQTAVMNFQQSNGLKPTGRIDKATGDLILQKAATVNKVNNLGNPVQNVKNTPPPLIARPKTTAPPVKSTKSSNKGTYKAGTAGMY